MKIINICICTCKRPKLLEICLSKVCEIQIPKNVSVFVSIIDNDPGRTAEAVFLGLPKHQHIIFHYFHETDRGIPYARNRAMNESIALKSDILVFIDDDEWPESDWLVRLYEYSKQCSSGTIVSGHVISDLPESTPEDIRLLFNKKKKKTGTILTSCATNNVLIPLEVIKDSGIRFDEANPLAGGTDTIFFCHLVNSGYSIIKCAEAIVHEIVPESRLNLQWLARRKYRAGITAAWRKQQDGRSKFSIIVSAVFHIILECCSWMMNTLLRDKVKRNLSTLSIYKSWGILSGLYGRKVESYKTVDGQ